MSIESENCNFSYKENLGKELTFLIKVKSKTKSFSDFNGGIK